MRGGARSLRSALVWLGRTLLPLPAASSDTAAIPSEAGALFTGRNNGAHAGLKTELLRVRVRGAVRKMMMMLARH